MKQNTVTISTSQNESDYLKKIAIDNGLTISENNKNPSEGKALKFLIKESIKNSKKKSDKNTNLDDLNKLIEQINVAIPHLIYNGVMNKKYIKSMLENINFTDEDIEKFNQQSAQETSQICGNIQKNNYKELYTSTDNNNMKTIPIEDDKNKWK